MNEPYQLQKAAPSGSGKDTGEREAIFGRNTGSILRVIIALVATIAASFIVFSGNERFPLGTHSSNFNLKDNGSFETDQLMLWNAFSIESSNEYGTFDMEYPWLGKGQQNILFEAHKMMTLTAKGIPDGINARFEWEFADTAGNSVASFTSEEATIQVQFNGLEKKTMAFTAKDFANNVLFKAQYVIYTKYVKRELRTLTFNDREKFLNAAHVLWEVPTEEGKARFGSGYTSIASFVEEHAIASNDVMCDQFHDGSGFFTHHMALQASFDAALKSVDPTVVLPYWDFTIEGQAITDLGESVKYFSKVTPFLSEEWFGEVDADGHIVNSRWAHTLFPTTSDSSTTGSLVKPNSYGLLRAYWNNNNDPEVSRYILNVLGTVAENKPIPNCQLHYNVLNATSLSDFQLLTPGDGHGPMHIHIGGVSGGITKDYANFLQRWRSILHQEYSDEHLAQVKGFTDDEITMLREFDSTYPLEGLLHYLYAGEFFIIYRGLWRSHVCARDNTPKLLVCPEHCAMDTPPADCRCSIPKLESGETSWEDVVNCVLYTESSRNLFKKAYPQELIKDLIFMTSRTNVIEGEMLESASPADIFFWLIHPALNRLEHAKRLTSVVSMSGVPINNWTAKDETWLEYSMYSFAPGENKAFPNGNVCAGHAASDAVLPDGLPLEPDFISRVDSNGDGVVSNWEFYTGTDPNDAQIDYVFDKFRWDHCTYDDVVNGVSDII